MTSLTKNFNLEEFECKDGSSVPEVFLNNVISLAKNLQVLRDELDKSITVTSGYRSYRYNKHIGGVSSSQHLMAKAADIQIPGLSPKEVHSMILRLIAQGRMKEGGVGSYNSFTHYDIRGNRARW